MRFYYDQVNSSFSNADPGLLGGLSDKDCASCANFLATAAKFRTDAQRVRGDAVHVLSAEAPPEQNGFVAVDVFLDAPAREIVRLDGSSVERLPPDERYHVTVFVKRVTDGWVIRAVKKEAS